MKHNRWTLSPSGWCKKSRRWPTQPACWACRAPRVSDVIRHQNSKFTVDAMIDRVVRTGQPLRISL
ncbi:MAG: hypothetical protein WBK51_02310 [Polaromonas sp.]